MDPLMAEATQRVKYRSEKAEFTSDTIFYASAQCALEKVHGLLARKRPLATDGSGSN